MKKTFTIISLILFLGIISFISFNSKEKPVSNSPSPEKRRLDVSKLKIDQENAYISLSSNDMEGYNRWIPFYFTFKENFDVDASKIDDMLTKKITSASLYADGKNIYQTTALKWSAVKLNNRKYNLTLVLNPELSDFKFDGVKTITHIELSFDSGSSKKYELPTYLIEQRPTVPEKLLSVCLSSTETEIAEDLTANAVYGIEKNENEINDFALDFPKSFSNIKSYKIVKTEQTDDNTMEYSITYQLDKNCPKTVFRPFLKVKYNNDESGWLVPSVPVYFNENALSE